MTAIAKPGLRQAKYTTHTDSECESPSVLTIDMRANWKVIAKVAKTRPSSIKAAIDNIERSLAVLNIWKEYLEQTQQEVNNGTE